MNFYEQLGTAVDAMGRSNDYCQYPLACVTLWIEPAVRHEQIYFFRDDAEQICGYMTWAWLAEDAEWRLLHDPNVLLHLSEWNEGERLWILDFLIHTGDVRAWVEEARSLFRGVAQSKSVRRRDDGSVRKITTWTKRGSCDTSRRKR